jgi:Ser/Thr protein kinase RdoA (MazF antagonist)
MPRNGMGNRITLQYLKKLFNHLNLGQIAATPQSVTGGFLHRMWRVDAPAQSYAVKELDPGVVESAQVREEYKRSEEMSRAFKKNGVPAVCALEIGGQTLHESDGKWFLVFDWVDGETCDAALADKGKAVVIAEVLGNMHRLNLVVSDKPGTDSDSGDEKNPYSALIDEAVEKNLPWAAAARGKAAELFALQQKGELFCARGTDTHRLSHGDMDQKNVLWQGDTPGVLDWEGAGYVLAGVEALDLGLHWSGLNGGRVDWDVFDAFLKKYRKTSDSQLRVPENALDAVVFDILGWMQANMHRSLGHTNREVGSIEIQSKEVREAIKKIEYLQTVEEKVAGSVREIWN